ncbi:MAG TPA: co-chaperone GroES [Candidatus Moranbacteria bacterium]|nr:co-chaperone GroES [Candidatus Moranbacteria bacterium]
MKKEAQKIRPLGENVLVETVKEQTKTKSGLVLPETATPDRPQQGKVIGIGDSNKIKVKKGQKIIFAKYSGSEIKIEEKDYIILKNEDILAVVE